MGRANIPATGGSMEPLIRDGDWLQVDLDLPRLEPGDVVVFRNRQEIVVHRVMEIHQTGESGFRFATKGDRLPWWDGWIPASRLVGRVQTVCSPRGELAFDTFSARKLARMTAFLSRQQAAWERVLEQHWGTRQTIGRRLARLPFLAPLWGLLNLWSGLLRRNAHSR